MSSEQTDPAFAALDYRNYDFTWEQAVRVLRKNQRIGMAFCGLLIALTLLVVICMKDVYQPVARIEIAPPTSGIRTLHEIESPPEVEYQDYLETETQILQSDALAVSVIRQLRLDKNSAFMGRQAGTGSAPIAPEDSNAPPGRGKAFLQEQIALATLTPSESEALDKFRQNLSVNIIRNTRLVEVSFASHDPDIARQIANEVIATFIQNDYKRRYDTTTQASEWLSSQLNELYQKVIASNRAVSEYQRKYGLVEMDDRDVPLSQLMGEVNHQLSEAQAARIENEAYLQMINSGQAEYVPTIRDDKVYQELLIRQEDLRTQLAQARAVYGDENMNVRKLVDQTAEVAKEISEQQKHLADGIRTAFSAAQAREHLMLRSREKLQAQMINANSEIVGYRALKSEAIANADLYNTLQARLKEAGIYAGLGSNNIRVVDLAENLQRPTGPHRAALFAIGTFVSVFLGILACFIKESLNNTVRTPEDVQAWAGLRSLALLPAMHIRTVGRTEPSTALGKLLRLPSFRSRESSTKSIVFTRPLTAEAEAMRQLRTSLTLSNRQRSLKAVLISSAMEGEGKTTVAVNFAITLAQAAPTCLVDSDLRKPMVAQAFGIESKPGLSEVLRGIGTLNSALVRVAAVPGLWILPSGSRPENPADLLASPQMLKVCDALRKQFQFIAIDSTPIMHFSDARHLSRLVDDVVLVGRCGVTTRRAIQRSTELLEDVQAPLAGIVLNDIDYSSPDYHYFMYGYCKAAGKRNKPPSIGLSSLLEDEQKNAEEAKGRGAHA